ncbi:MAG: 4,5-DOPA dioxygenase extradiol [Hydrogenophaga sp.]
MISRRLFLESSSLGAVSAALLSLSAHVPTAHAAKIQRQPVLFIGHGSPMNAISNNLFTRELAAWGRRLSAPKAILMVSAHWLTKGATGVTVNDMPRTIHDFGGFPRELHEMQYPAKGHPALARSAAQLIRSNPSVPTTEWGLDHGTWTVLHHMFPKANVPVFQVSIDYDKPAPFHYTLGRELQALREQGVLIIGSGNIVHNLGAIDRGTAEQPLATRPWAQSFDDRVKLALDQREDKSLLNYLTLDEGARMAVPTPDHYWPFIYALGAADAGQAPKHVFAAFHSGTLSMRCLQFG